MASQISKPIILQLLLNQIFLQSQNPYSILKSNIKLTSSQRHTCLLDSSKPKKPLLACWGDNSHSQSTLPSQTNSKNNASTVEVGLFATCLIRVLNDELYCWGLNELGQTDIPIKLKTGVGQVSLKAHTTCALRVSKELVCFGNNDLGQANVPDKFSKNENIIIAIAGGFHSCVLLSSNEINCWGSNDQGQIDLPLDYSMVKHVFQMKLGLIHTCILQDYVNLNCFGFEKWDSLQSPFKGMLLRPIILNVQVGIYHNCLVKYNSVLVCWGYDIDKILAFQNEWLFNVKDVALGEKHTCIYRQFSDDTKNSIKIKCFGENDYAQLDLPNNGIVNDKFFKN